MHGLQSGDCRWCRAGQQGGALPGLELIRSVPQRVGSQKVENLSWRHSYVKKSWIRGRAGTAARPHQLSELAFSYYDAKPA